MDPVTVVGATPPVELTALETLLQILLLSIHGTGTTALPGTRGNGVEVEMPAIVGTGAGVDTSVGIHIREIGPRRPLPPETPMVVPRLSPISTRKD